MNHVQTAKWKRWRQHRSGHQRKFGAQSIRSLRSRHVLRTLSKESSPGMLLRRRRPLQAKLRLRRWRRRICNSRLRWLLHRQKRQHLQLCKMQVSNDGIRRSTVASIAVWPSTILAHLAVTSANSIRAWVKPTTRRCRCEIHERWSETLCTWPRSWWRSAAYPITRSKDQTWPKFAISSFRRGKLIWRKRSRESRRSRGTRALPGSFAMEPMLAHSSSKLSSKTKTKLDLRFRKMHSKLYFSWQSVHFCPFLGSLSCLSL